MGIGKRELDGGGVAQGGDANPSAHVPSDSGLCLGQQRDLRDGKPRLAALRLRLSFLALVCAPGQGWARTDYGIADGGGTALWIPVVALIYGATKSRWHALAFGVTGLLFALFFPVLATVMVCVAFGLVILSELPVALMIPAALIGGFVAYVVIRNYANS